jgi:hypothetical protein
VDAAVTLQQRLCQPGAQLAAFFLAFWLYVWLWIDPNVLYHGAGLVQFPWFSEDLLFLKRFLRYPGGPVESAAALLSQCYYYPCAGAIVITAVALLTTLATRSFVTAVAGESVPLLHFIPAILVLVLCNRYAHALAMLVGLLVGLAAACAYVRMAGRGSARRFVVFLVLSGPLYFLAGGAYILYAAVCGIFELRTRRTRMLGLCYLLLAEVIPYAVGTYVFDLRLADACGRLLPFHPDGPVRAQAAGLCLYLCVPMVALVGTVWPRIAAVASGAKRSRMRMLAERFRSLRNRPGPELALVLVTAVAAAVLSFDATSRTLLRINRFAVRGMWSGVLEEAGRLRRDRYTFAAMIAVNRALYETGKLPSKMFSYPQHPFALMAGVPAGGEAALPMYERRKALFFQRGDEVLRLGLVNEAQREAHNALEHFGPHPVILKRLALINIIKGQTEAAEVFLRALSRCVGYQEWAGNALRRLEADRLWSEGPGIERVRSLMITGEPTAQSVSLEKRLDALLRSNGRNRMAFEYRMAFYLLCRQLDKFAADIDRLDELEYPDIPWHYEEAVVIHEAVSGEQVELRGQQTDPRTREAFGEFDAAWQAAALGGDVEAAWHALAPHFGDTYFFYYAFGESGARGQ